MREAVLRRCFRLLLAFFSGVRICGLVPLSLSLWAASVSDGALGGKRTAGAGLDV